MRNSRFCDPVTLRPKLDYVELRNVDGALFINALQIGFRIKNTAALCRRLHRAPSLLSKICHQKLPVSDDLIVAIHEEFEMSVPRVKQLMRSCYLPAKTTSRHTAHEVKRIAQAIAIEFGPSFFKGEASSYNMS